MLCQLTGEELIQLRVEHSICHELQVSKVRSIGCTCLHSACLEAQPFSSALLASHTFLFLLICVAMLGETLYQQPKAAQAVCSVN